LVRYGVAVRSSINTGRCSSTALPVDTCWMVVRVRPCRSRRFEFGGVSWFNTELPFVPQAIRVDGVSWFDTELPFDPQVIRVVGWSKVVVRVRPCRSRRFRVTGGVSWFDTELPFVPQAIRVDGVSWFDTELPFVPQSIRWVEYPWFDTELPFDTQEIRWMVGGVT
jgi:hypothetical protein